MNGCILEVCGDCRLQLPRGEGPRHPYLGASASCWALYGQVLAREYSDPAYMKVHRLTVDAYAAQHPGKPERRSIQSVWVHLVGLHLVVERKSSGDFARQVIGALAGGPFELNWLVPPDCLGPVTVADVARAADAKAHTEAVLDWANSVWASWRDHHDLVRVVAERAARAL